MEESGRGEGVESVPSLTSILSFVCGGIPKVAGTKLSGCSLNPNPRVGLVSCNLRASVCDMHSVGRRLAPRVGTDGGAKPAMLAPFF